MIRSGAEYLESLRDGRVVYVGGERVEDVTTHPGFRNAARSYARVFDARFEDRFRDQLSFEEKGEHHAMYYLRPRSREDLERRSRSAEIIADLTYGMMGRSPDFIGGYVAGAAMQPEVFDSGGRPFAANLLAYYERCKREDLFLSHAVTPPPGSKDESFAGRTAEGVPTALAVMAERDDGVVISGLKMLATSAAFSDHVWIGNIQPLATGHEKESITCVIPANAPGLSLWSRKAFERYAVSEVDNPLAYRFDESDCIVVCDGVKVPWENVFTLDDIELSRQIYFRTPAHTLSNHQACVRYRSKLRLLLGLARRMTESSGIDSVPAVRDEIGHLAAQYGMIDGMIQGQIHDFLDLGNGYVNYNRHMMYAAIYWCTQNYDHICSKVRELSGGGVMQMPADISVMENDDTRAPFEALWRMPGQGALDRFKLYKLAWDLLGSDFAGRHMQYERFYMGPAYVVPAATTTANATGDRSWITWMICCRVTAPGPCSTGGRPVSAPGTRAWEGSRCDFPSTWGGPSPTSCSRPGTAPSGSSSRPRGRTIRCWAASRCCSRRRMPTGATGQTCSANASSSCTPRRGRPTPYSPGGRRGPPSSPPRGIPISSCCARAAGSIPSTTPCRFPSRWCRAASPSRSRSGFGPTASSTSRWTRAPSSP